MDRLFSRMIGRYAPPMNEKVMEGLAVSSLEYLEEYLDSQIRSICHGMPSCFRYVGYERCMPDDEYGEVTKLRSGNRRVFELAPSSMYLLKLFFVFTDKLGHEHEITRHIYLPRVDRGGIITVSGTKYHLIPVLSDKVFTPSDSSVFVRLTQDRNNMFRMYNTVVADGRRETRYVVHATIYRSPDSKRTKSSKRPVTTLVHYLLGKYGFHETFQRFAGVVPEVGYGNDISRDKYPEESWIIYESTKQKPATCQEKAYRPTTIKVAVPREKWSLALEALVFGLYYVLDHFPGRFAHPTTSEQIDEDGVIHSVADAGTVEDRTRYLKRCLEDLALWKILIGIIVLSEGRGENSLYKDISEHFESLDAYLDSNAKAKLEEKNIFLNNYYDLLAYVAINFNDMILCNEDQALNVYGKNLEILSYVLYDITYGFTTMKFNLNKAANRRDLTLKDITSHFQQYIKMGAMFSIHSGKIITKAVSYSGDHLYPGITAVIAEQENRAGAARGQSNRVVVGKQHRIHLSMITVGSVLNLPKANPTPIARINPWVTMDERTNTVIPNPKFQALLEENMKYFRFQSS